MMAGQVYFDSLYAGNQYMFGMMRDMLQSIDFPAKLWQVCDLQNQRFFRPQPFLEQSLLEDILGPENYLCEQLTYNRFRIQPQFTLQRSELDKKKNATNPELTKALTTCAQSHTQ